MDDYYDLVGVDRSASRETIDRRIRDQLRLWQRRTTSADLDRRQEAERKVQQLSEARSTLLDEEKRRRYDRQLGAYRSSDPPPALPAVTDPGPSGVVEQTGTANWLDQARGYLAKNDHHSAAYAARETLRSMPNPPTEAWTLLARANAGLGRLDDALFEARRATTIEPASAEAHLALARVHEQRREWRDAARAFETAGTLDPGAEAPHLGMARSLARAGRAESAVERLERRYTRARDRTREGRLLGLGLMEVAEEAVRPRGPAGAGSAAADLALAQRLLGRVRQVSDDHQLLVRANRLAQEVSRRRYPGGGAPTTGGFKPPTGAYRRPGEQLPTNGLAIASLVVSLVAPLTMGMTGPVGAILGHVARRQIQERGEAGDGFALAGIIIGWVAFAVLCCAGAVIFTNMW